MADDPADPSSSSKGISRERSPSKHSARTASLGARTGGEIDARSTSISRFRRWCFSRNGALALVLLGMLALLAVEVRYIATEAASRSYPGQPSANSQVAAASTESSQVALETPASSVASADTSAEPVEQEVFDEPPEPAKPEKPRNFKTVEEASTGSCSTGSVDGLSRQIIEQVRCSNPKALVSIPARPNLVLDQHIFAYLESSARDHFLRVLDAHRDRTMKVHSILRTVAQQYLVRRWAGGNRCGVQMATLPGESNHETGRAIDIADVGRWRAALEAEGFRWLGAADNVHFDFIAKRNGASPERSLDVLAFQQLWNRNHRNDAIPEDGRYSREVEQRLKRSPPKGFTLGPNCRLRK